MAAPKLELTVEPVENGKVVYLPIAPTTRTGTALSKIVLRLQIRNKETKTVKLKAITFSFPGSSHAAKEMQGVNMDGSLDLAAGAAEFWSNGNVDLDPDPDVKDIHNNAAYLAGTPPTKVRVSIEARDFSGSFVATYDLAPHKSPVAEGAYRFPYAAGDLRANEYYQTDAVHWANGGAEGGQIYAHDIGCVGWDAKKKQWSGLLPDGSDKVNADYRIYGKPVRAVADGTVVSWHDGMAENTSQPEFPDPSPEPKSGNHIIVQHGTETVKYCHFQNGSIPATLQKEGARVYEGQLLGRVGNTGNASAPHTHIATLHATKSALRPMPFRSGFVVDKSKLAPPKNSGPWFRLNGHGISMEPVAIWPASTSPGSPVPTVGISMGGTWANSFFVSGSLQEFSDYAQKLFDDNGRRLVRATTFVEGGARRWAGIARAGNWASRFWVSDSMASFQATAQKLFDDQQLRLEQIDTYVEGTKRKWMGIARGGDWASRLIYKTDLQSFSEETQKLFDDHGLRLTYVTNWVQGGKRHWFGIARSGTWANRWWISPSWDHFRIRSQQLFDDEQKRLVHVTSFVEGGVRKWVGIARSGDWANRLYLRSDFDQFSLEAQRLFEVEKLRLVHVHMLE